MQFIFRVDTDCCWLNLLTHTPNGYMLVIYYEESLNVRHFFHLRETSNM